MSRLSGEAGFLKRILLSFSAYRSTPQPYKIHRFSTKGKKRSKSDLSNGEELSKKDAALQAALDHIRSTFGNGSIMWVGQPVPPLDFPVVSTGCFALDMALGIGGLPKGRVVEIYGPEASGKTTLALHVIAESQKQGGYCVFIDAEHALDASLAESIGVSTEKLLLSQPDCGEQALSLVDTLIRSGSIDVIVVDSVAALVPKNELDGEMGDAHVAMQARLMSQALRKLSHALSLSQTVLIFTNQVRAKLSTFGGFGMPTEVTCGGNALKFYASVRLNIKRIGMVKKGEEVIGSRVQVKIVKNKLSPPFKVVEFEQEFGKGVCREIELLEFGLKHRLITRGGAYYTYNGQTFSGRENFKQFLAQNGTAKQELELNLKRVILGEQGGETEHEGTNASSEWEPEEETVVSDAVEESVPAQV